MPSNDLTLAISLRALGRLTRPNDALEDAATWTNHVGIISAEPSFIERRRVREAGYHQDFMSGPRSIEEALSAVGSHFESARYVFVGTDGTSEVVEGVSDWSYQPVSEAAMAAGWTLETTSSTVDG